MITYSFLQHYWWLIVSLLGSILAFLLFVQGGQSMIFSLGKTEDERRLIVNVLGRKWEFTFTTLVTFGGAFFASFPLFYSTSFGGAYWVWMLILLCFVLQAVSYEFQNKPNNVFGANTYRAFLFFNGLAGTFLIGGAIATFFTGSNFSVNKLNLVDTTSGMLPVISQWQSPWLGLEVLLEGRVWLLGLAVFFLSRTLAVLYFKNRISNDTLEKRFGKALLLNAVPFLVFFLSFVIWTLLAEGFAVNVETGEIYMEKYKYFFNLIQMPAVLVLFLVGVVGVLYGIIWSLLKSKWSKGIWFAGPGTIFTVLALLLLAGYNNTAYYPAVGEHIQSSLTIANSSSSYYTLKAMAIVSLLVPFVLAYIFYAWKCLEPNKTTVDEINHDHAY